MDIHNFYKSKKVLITGNTGFIGGWLSSLLLEMGADVHGISLKPHTNPNIFETLNLQKNVNTYFSDITLVIP